ncbi:hypothetical protein Bequi_13510 [Brachybacterium sp. JHP9]|uniref:Uncharacterized protein n=1 Tax=Brachybacterium equifaecis TaxID=2910770 RepID=A0ABT0R385_9MICO|nr:hypothetical protein [Brachybacterium equifaecis]MCL6424382.1 hypothetical protein [Brachybacterium equifaecis]
MTDSSPSTVRAADPIAEAHRLRDALCLSVDEPERMMIDLGGSLACLMGDVCRLAEGLRRHDLAQTSGGILLAVRRIHGIFAALGQFPELIPASPQPSRGAEAALSLLDLAMSLVKDALIDWASSADVAPGLQVPSVVGRLLSAERTLREIAGILDIPLERILAASWQIEPAELDDDGLPHRRDAEDLIWDVLAAPRPV